MSEFETKLGEKFSYGLATSLGKKYAYFENRHEELDFADNLHMHVIMMNNQLRDELSEAYINQLREEFSEASGSGF